MNLQLLPRITFILLDLSPVHRNCCFNSVHDVLMNFIISKFTFYVFIQITDKNI